MFTPLYTAKVTVHSLHVDDERGGEGINHSLSYNEIVEAARDWIETVGGDLEKHGNDPFAAYEELQGKVGFIDSMHYSKYEATLSVATLVADCNMDDKPDDMPEIFELFRRAPLIEIDGRLLRSVSVHPEAGVDEPVITIPPTDDPVKRAWEFTRDDLRSFKQIDASSWIMTYSENGVDRSCQASFFMTIPLGVPAPEADAKD